MLAIFATGHAAHGDVSITLCPDATGRTFEGVGGVSAGASTRNLVDYPQPQRDQVLDYLFKSKFGAGMQHLKVEIGGGDNSTCGSEMADGQKAGLCHFAGSHSTLGISQIGDTRTIEYKYNGKITAGPAITGRDLWLKST